MKFGRQEWRTVIGTRWEGIVQLGVGICRIARIRDRGPWVTGVRTRRVRAVSMGDRRIAVSEVEISERSRVAMGEVEVKMSEAREGEISSSGKPTMAERRLRMKVFNVGWSRE